MFEDEFHALTHTFAIVKECHSREDWQGIGEAFEKYEMDLAMKNLGDSEKAKWLSFGVTFLDCWSDCANHGYCYYEPIKKGDWPILADQILDAIKKDRPFEKLELNGTPLKQLYP